MKGVETLTKLQIDKLSKSSKNDVPLFSLEGRKVWVKVVGVYDADTCRVVLFLEGKLSQFSVRLSGIDTPEMRPVEANQIVILRKNTQLKPAID